MAYDVPFFGMAVLWLPAAIALTVRHGEVIITKPANSIDSMP